VVVIDRKPIVRAELAHPADWFGAAADGTTRTLLFPSRFVVFDFKAVLAFEAVLSNRRIRATVGNSRLLLATPRAKRCSDLIS
jgi:hypothetical protein